jgi:hypothetical protein
MSSETKLDSNIAAIIAAWRKKPEAIITAMEIGLRTGLRQFEGQRMIKEQMSGRKGNDYGLNVFTGNARNATNVRIYRQSSDIVGVITVADRAWYLKVHQHFKFGGYIRPKNATLLAIPVNPAARGRRPADFNLVFIKRPGKTPILIRQVRRGGSSKVAGAVRPIVREDIMFVLKPRVYVPKRLYFFEEFGTYGKNMIKFNILERLREVNNAE